MNGLLVGLTEAQVKPTREGMGLGCGVQDQEEALLIPQECSLSMLGVELEPEEGLVEGLRLSEVRGSKVHVIEGHSLSMLRRRVFARPNVRVEAGPTALRLAREAHHAPKAPRGPSAI